MSIGCFFGIGAASSDTDDIEQLREHVRAALRTAGLPDYVETGDLEACDARYEELHAHVRHIRWGGLDTLGSGSLARFAGMVVRSRPDQAGPLRDLVRRSNKQVYVPGSFDQRVDALGLPDGCLWSIAALQTALRAAALTLGLPLSNGTVPDALLPKIAKCRTLGKHDTASDEPDDHGFSMLEHYRPAWLTLSEFARVAQAHPIALVLA